MKFVFLNFMPVNKVLKKNFSIDYNLRPALGPAPAKLDPNWVTGFVDAEGCFSVIIEVLNPLK
jgi:hypothetical protein